MVRAGSADAVAHFVFHLMCFSDCCTRLYALLFVSMNSKMRYGESETRDSATDFLREATKTIDYHFSKVRIPENFEFHHFILFFRFLFFAPLMWNVIDFY